MAEAEGVGSKSQSRANLSFSVVSSFFCCRRQSTSSERFSVSLPWHRSLKNSSPFSRIAKAFRLRWPWTSSQNSPLQLLPFLIRGANTLTTPLPTLSLKFCRLQTSTTCHWQFSACILRAGLFFWINTVCVPDWLEQSSELSLRHWLTGAKWWWFCHLLLPSSLSGSAEASPSAPPLSWEGRNEGRRKALSSDSSNSVVVSFSSSSTAKLSLLVVYEVGTNEQRRRHAYFFRPFSPPAGLLPCSLLNWKKS